ncbi:hypothetical protein D1610_13700 [Sphingomonas gilva]|uniref:J domain-containing protein n=1 Tax=Sphingomonas gilva TaxID=2305907 RepID=A0A396RL00_9SPHN|nr:hypothetical protein [Sphingomonas gilva]RHW16779.1 hypothetical protein D1610_13700 [Sphingomonas gilva]
MSRSVWRTLGVPAGSDRVAIRRGYAAKLRQTNPEDDPEGFKTLRAAYDQALAMADARAWQAEHGGDADGWADEDYDDSAREAVFTATPTPDELNAAPTEPAPLPASPDAHLLDGRERDLADFEARMNALAGHLTSPWAQDDAVLEAAFRHVLASPAMAEIAIRAHAEEWIAGLLASNIPKSDALLLQAIEAFGWDGAGWQRGQSPAVAAILHRIDEWRTIEALTSHGDQYHFAFTELTKPPRGEWGMRLTAINPGVAPRIRTLIDYSEWQMPGLRHSFNADTVAWWREHLSRPRMTLGRLLLAPALFTVLLALGAIFKPPTPWDMVLLIVGAVASLALPWAHLATIGRLTHARDTGVGPGLPRWAETGWIAPIFALPIAAMFVPPSPGWAVVALLVAACGMQWTQLTAGGRRWRETGENAFAWILTIGVYGFFGFVPFLALPPHAMLALSAAAALVIHARVAAIDRLMAIGEPLTQRFKVPGLVAIVVLGSAALNSPLLPPFIAGAAFAVTALLVNAMFHGQIGWLRYVIRVAIAIAFLGASAVSMPDEPKATGIAGGTTYSPSATTISGRSTEIAMKRLEDDQPGLVLLRTNNPELYAELRAVVDARVSGRIDGDQASRRFDEKLNAAYRRMLPSAPDVLLIDGLRLELQRRKALLMSNPAACAGSGEIDGDDLPANLRQEELAHIFSIVSAPAQAAMGGSTGRPVADDLVFSTTANRLGVTPAKLSSYLRSDAPVHDQCVARIEMLQVVLEQPSENIAATVRAMHAQQP